MADGVSPRLAPWPVLAFYAYTATRSAAFTVPIYVLFFLSRDLSMAQVGAVEALFTVVVLLAETPTGYVGDRIGRRDSMLVGTLLSAAGAVGYALAHSFPAFLAVSALRALAGAFRSGSTDAWLFETLAEDRDEDRFAHVRGRASSLGRVVRGATAVAGAALYAIDPLAPWLLEALVVAGGAVVLLSVDDPDTDERSEQATIRHVAGVARRTLSKRAVGAFVLYTGLLFGLLNTLAIFVQPVSVRVVGVRQGDLGLVYAGFTVLSAVLSAQAGRIRETLGARTWFAVAPPALGLVLAAVVVAPRLALPAFFAARGTSAVSGPLASQYLNDRSDSAGRATVLSAASMVRSAVTAPLNLAGGALAAAVALPLALGSLGVALAAGSVAILAWRFPVVEDAADAAAVGTD